ncbi:MAG: helix-turn-helix domain-containing protein [Vicingaceae bacterium]|nr:helix-turn-helix domain-containing protein [Vicingaceae bacterium]
MEQSISFDNLPDAVFELNEKLDRIEKMLLLTKSNSSNEESGDLLTIKEASDFLHLSKATLYSKVSKGELPYMKRSKRLYFSKTELTEYLKKGRIKTNDEVKDDAHNNLK